MDHIDDQQTVGEQHSQEQHSLVQIIELDKGSQRQNGHDPNVSQVLSIVLLFQDSSSVCHVLQVRALGEFLVHLQKYS